MNYRNLTMDEMVVRLCDEPDADTFIEMSKAFIQKFADGDYISTNELEQKLEYARDEGQDRGYGDARDVCREEAVSLVDTVSSQINHDTYSFLEKNLNTIG